MPHPKIFQIFVLSTRNFQLQYYGFMSSCFSSIPLWTSVITIFVFQQLLFDISFYSPFFTKKGVGKIYPMHVLQMQYRWKCTNGISEDLEGKIFHYKGQRCVTNARWKWYFGYILCRIMNETWLSAISIGFIDVGLMTLKLSNWKLSASKHI